MHHEFSRLCSISICKVIKMLLKNRENDAFFRHSLCFLTAFMLNVKLFYSEFFACSFGNSILVNNDVHSFVANECF